MVRLRRQYNLATLMSVVLVFGVNFAWVPWPVSVILAIAMLIPVVLVGLALFHWLLICALAGVLVGLTLPPIVSHHPRRRARPIITTPAPSVPNGDVPP